jgi:squalene-hopene/tetraprenyl-beta-curcumene cyclase
MARLHGFRIAIREMRSAQADVLDAIGKGAGFRLPGDNAVTNRWRARADRLLGISHSTNARHGLSTHNRVQAIAPRLKFAANRAGGILANARQGTQRPARAIEFDWNQERGAACGRPFRGTGNLATVTERMVMKKFRLLIRGVAAVALCMAVAAPGAVNAVWGQQSEVPDRAAWQETVDRAVTYLREHGQAEDGSFSSYAGPGVTALVATSLLNNGVAIDDPMVAKALEYVKGFVQPSGGIHANESLYANYETSLAIMCFAAANQNGEYDEVIRNAAEFIKRSQWGGTEQMVESSDNRYGGSGYGKSGRPDLSNTVFTIEALVAAGTEENREAIERALVFVSRSQNFPSGHNQTGFAEKNPDGGFYYTPAGEGESKAGTTSDGGLRSYASMTYAGLRSMLYAGVDRDDPRVQAAVDWIRHNYDLESNPGMGTAGLYYYYHIFAKALANFGEDTFTDNDGNKHDWRAELLAELASRQQEDGSWVNSDNERWLENDPNLVTGYVLLALAYCKPAK